MVQTMKKKTNKRTKKLFTALKKNRNTKLSKGKFLQKDQQLSDVNKKKISVEKSKERKKRQKEDEESGKNKDDTEEKDEIVIDDNNDFTNEKQLGGLDISSFFKAMVDTVNTNENSDKEESETKNKEDIDTNKKEKNAGDDDNDTASSSSVLLEDELEDVEKEEADMKEELKKLKSADPEFHDYLQENERDLLEFAEDEEEEEVEDEDEEMNESTLISLKDIEKYENEEVLSIKSLKKVMKLYKGACCSSDLSKVTTSADVFDRLLLLALSKCHVSFRHHLLDEESVTSSNEAEETPIMINKLSTSPNCRTLKHTLKQFFKSTHRLLTQAQEAKLRIFILEQLKPYLAFLSPFPSYAMHYFKLFLHFWSSTLSSDATHQIRLESYLSIRILALTQPFPFIETALKKCYLSYARISKFVTNHDGNFATLTLLGNCCVDLYSIDTDSSYQHAFVYIRQLALLLRKAKTEPTSDSIRAVYCWQYIHCCKLWVAVLAANPDELNQLYYPITELLLGVIRLVPEHVKYLPLKFHVIRLLHQLSSSTDIFIPTLSFLLEVLDDSKNWMTKQHKHQSSRTTQTIRLPYLLKLPNTISNPSSKYINKEHQQIIFQEVFTLLRHDVELYKYSPAFPEYSTPLLMHVRKFKQEQKDLRNKNFAKHLLQIVETNIEFSLKIRSSSITDNPKDVTKLECCKPKDVKDRTQRYKEIIEKEKKEFILLSSQQAATAKPPADAPTTKTTKDDTNDTSATKKEKTKAPKIKARKEVKKIQPKKDGDDMSVDVLQEEDTLQEGLDWSDGDEDERDEY